MPLVCLVEVAHATFLETEAHRDVWLDWTDGTNRVEDGMWSNLRLMDIDQSFVEALPDEFPNLETAFLLFRNRQQQHGGWRIFEDGDQNVIIERLSEEEGVEVLMDGPFKDRALSFRSNDEIVMSEGRLLNG